MGDLGAVLLPLATRSTGALLLIGWVALLGLGSVVYNVNQVSLRQAITPERMQGRMNATMRFMVWGTIPIGSFLGGVLGRSIGLRPTLWIGAAGGVLAFLWPLLSPVRRLRVIPGAPAEQIPETLEAALVAAEEGLPEPGSAARP